MLGGIVKSAAILLGLLVVAAILLWWRVERQRKALLSAACGFVNSVFLSETYKPTVRVLWAYGSPTFTLCYLTREDQRDAESKGHSRAFVERIQQLCNDVRVRGGRFDAFKAVAITSKPEILEWEQEAVAIRSGVKSGAIKSPPEVLGRHEGESET